MEKGEEDAMLALVGVEDSNVDVRDLAVWLRQRHLEAALAKVYLSKGRIVDVLELWTA